MQKYYADFHLHTVLSPCGDLLMTPQNIIEQALKLGLDIIAITDHNSAKNVAVAVELAADTNLTVIPGMEVETKEEVHLLCLFPTVDKVLEWQKIVDEALPETTNDEDVFGPQIITDLKDQYVEKEEKLLLRATNLSVQGVVTAVTDLEGIVIPAHVDKTNYSLISNLGFINPELDIIGVEISTNIAKEKAEDKFKQLKEYSLLSNSDAHYLEDISKKMILHLKEVNFSEIKKAIQGVGRRKVEIIE
ncbi:MAG: PHP domain-containing protein [Bacillota bacterium]